MMLVAVVTAAFLFSSLAVQIEGKGVVFCYFASWSADNEGDGKFDVSNINSNLCTHILYAFFGVNENDGSIDLMDNKINLIEQFNNLKNSNGNLKTLASIGGGSYPSGKFSDLARDPGKRQTFINSCISFCKQYKFDGIDLDWEYPGHRGGNPNIDKQNYASLLKEMRQQFTKNGLLMTAAVPVVPENVDVAFDVPVLQQNLDYILLMEYDFYGYWGPETKKTGINAPLYAGPSDSEWQRANANIQVTVDHWINKGASPQKLVLGVPFYGNSFTLANPSETYVGAPVIDAGNPGPITKSPGSLAYTEICLYIRNNQWTVRREESQRVPYAFHDNQWVGYDDIQSIQEKLEFAKRKNMAGMMVWALNNDDFRGKCGTKWPLLNTIHNGVNSFP